MARTRVVVRRNGRVVGHMTYGSEAEAVAHAAKMQGAAAGLEALLAPAAPASNRRKRTRRNPSIGRGTKHRDIVAHAVEERLREEGVPKREARSRGYAIATASEKARRRGKVYVSRLRANPTPIDIASLDFDHFKKTVIIDTEYPTRSGRRFARVISKDGTFVTDVPVSDGGISGNAHRVRGADAIKKRAWEQLRVHLKPSTWKPSVRVNPAGSVAYGGTSIRISDGTYTVMPHGPSFRGPDGFVSAKRWVDTHGA